MGDSSGAGGSFAIALLNQTESHLKKHFITKSLYRLATGKPRKRAQIQSFRMDPQPTFVQAGG